jgi:enoyl-CoA hydratase/carnithine racemase
MSYSSFVFESRDGVSTIWLNDPEKLNALTFETYRELENVMADLAHDARCQSGRHYGTGKFLLAAVVCMTSSGRCLK